MSRNEQPRSTANRADETTGAPQETEADAGRLFRYRGLWTLIVISTCLVSLIPLVVMVVVNYHQYHHAFSEEVQHPLHLQASNARRTLRFFLDERLSALDYVVHDSTHQELCEPARLRRVFNNLKKTYGDLVDVGVIHADGLQHTYVGPYPLRDKDYSKQDWFRDVMLHGRGVSDVYMGYRRFPHFTLAVRGRDQQGQDFILRATLNAEVLVTKGVTDEELPKARDSFIINRRGVLQTPSKHFGRILTRASIAVPPQAKTTRVIEERGRDERMHVVAYGYVTKTPFILMVVERRATLLTSWFKLRNKLVLFLGVSIVGIVLVILFGATYMVNRIREADSRRVALLHRVEYTAKMASIGRLAAGVAHEVNNPLAIINEKAGLLKDILAASDDFPRKDKIERQVQPILDSVDRCARITRRLLRFAKHIDVHPEAIQLEELMREVLSFLEKECAYRNVTVTVNSAPAVPQIESDRGRLQQVFLNLINNALGAIEDGGEIRINVEAAGDSKVSVAIRDDGVGIPEENLQHIFEPFFTTKEKHGTGLGLSITYGLVEKLGGTIAVASEVGEWTEFTVTLPIRPPKTEPEEGRHAGPVGR